MRKNPLAHLLPLLLLSLCLPAAPCLAQTLKIATIAPDGTRWMEEIRAGAEQIAERTAGRVKFKIYPGGIMGNDATVMRKIRAGQLHGGAFTAGTLSEVYPDMQIYGVPFLLRDYTEVDSLRSKVDPLLAAGLEAQGMVALGISEGGFAYLMSDSPVVGVADLAGKKVWIPEGDEVGAAGLRATGVTPVSLPIADAYTGLQTGLIDTVATTPSAAIAFQWHTKLKAATDLPLSYLIGVLAVDQSAFGKLGASDQTTVRQVMGEVFRRLDRFNREDNAGARAALEKRGIQFLRPDAVQQARWQEAGARARADLISQGVYSAGMMGVVSEHLEQFRKEHAARND